MSCDISIIGNHTFSATQFNPCTVFNLDSTENNCVIKNFDCAQINPNATWFCTTKINSFTTCTTFCPAEFNKNYSCKIVNNRKSLPANPGADEPVQDADLEQILGTTFSTGFIISLL